jgi:LPXTG-site transpeptidase (sortase) family protein
MAKRRRRRRKKSNTSAIGGKWLPNMLIWGGVFLMLVGGITAYPTIQSYLMTPDAESLEFSVTATPPATAGADQATPQTEPAAAAPTASPVPVEVASLNEGQIETPPAPAPVILPETELIVNQEPPTATAPVEQAEEQATASPEPTPTPAPTPTPPPTPTPDPASLVPGRLVIPAISLDAPVVSVGWDTKEVNGQPVSSWIVPDSFAAGWHSTSALPRDAGNTVLNGHHNINGEVFRDLEDLQPGDEIIIQTGDKTHHYAVTERHILEEKYQSAEVRRQNAQFIMPTDDRRLTLVTCWPYTNNTHRLVIVALPFEPTPAPTPILE